MARIKGRKRERGIEELELLLNKSTITVQPFQSNHLNIAREAYTRYGKASGHPAKLNFGDCFSYALAKHRNDILLCKGDDFSRTDIKVVAY
ncbi:MAG: type II toxin-antitoxin system VapC family toxin [Pseudomonadota bacterium]|nr:type II toxin-antitoxin system VapC family toxin [Pseudomonadota bacterium]MDE3038235.1 type II toxin-antitoxin system VapC family toxin [Pseudomonadota bacterium]